jgi:Leucine-rich repeat (LRR) protein
MPGRTKTASFGTTKRESHDASRFYSRNLYGDGLAYLPGGIGNLRNLTELDLQSNSLTELPAQIASLTKLVTLNV